MKKKMKNLETDFSKLPSEYEPLYEGIPIPIINIDKKAYYLIHDFSSIDEAQKFINRFCCYTGNYDFHIHKEENVLLVKPYCVMAPFSISLQSAFLNEYRGRFNPFVKFINYNEEKLLNKLYRNVGSKKYVDSFFEKGDILISTFKRCRKLENINRVDKYELMNEFIINDGVITLDSVIGIDKDSLVFCTSKDLPSSDEKENNIVIKDVQGFLNKITSILCSFGIPVAEVVSGSCFYDDKKIEVKVKDDSLREIIEKDNNIVNQLEKITNQFIQINEHKIHFNKPKYYEYENEYRIVFETEGSIDFWKIDKKRISIINGESIIIHAPELREFCERV